MIESCICADGLKETAVNLTLTLFISKCTSEWYFLPMYALLLLLLLLLLQVRTVLKSKYKDGSSLLLGVQQTMEMTGEGWGGGGRGKVSPRLRTWCPDSN